MSTSADFLVPLCGVATPFLFFALKVNKADTVTKMMETSNSSLLSKPFIASPGNSDLLGDGSTV